jgi:hypothetical protein
VDELPHITRVVCDIQYQGFGNLVSGKKKLGWGCRVWWLMVATGLVALIEVFSSSKAVAGYCIGTAS